MGVVSSFLSRAPGKVILSGEHAVVYGRPALVMAVNRYVEARVEGLRTPFFTLFMNGETRVICGMDELAGLRASMDVRYGAYVEGELSIGEVVRCPGDLVGYAAALFFEESGVSFSGGVQVEVTLGIPLSSGMGSSAAIILAVLDGLCGLCDVSWGDVRLYEGALRTEQLQHGRSSGVDPYTCLHGGVFRFVEGAPRRLSLRPRGLRLVHTGVAESSTGECVGRVREVFGDSALWDQFEGVTDYIESALLDGDGAALKVGLNKNHDLLCTLGVVPVRVQEFVDAVLGLGGAAKVCGAGSIRGDAAGLVLVDLDVGLEGLCADFGYAQMDCEVDEDGVVRL